MRASMATYDNSDQSPRPTCNVGLIGKHDLTLFDRCITDNPHMDIHSIEKYTSTRTRSIVTRLVYPNDTVGILNLYVVSDPSDLDNIRCDVLVMNISDSEPYYKSEHATAQKWAEHNQRVRGDDHKVVTLNVRYDDVPYNDPMLPLGCTAKTDDRRVLLDCTNYPMRFIARLWILYLNVPPYSPVLYNPRKDQLRSLSINIDRVGIRHDVPTILDRVFPRNSSGFYPVCPTGSEEIHRDHTYIIGTMAGDIFMKFSEDTDIKHLDDHLKYDILMVVVNRHKLISNYFKRYMDTECAVASAHSVFVCVLPDDNCTNPDCIIQCTKHVGTAFNKFVRRFDNVDEVVQLTECYPCNSPLIDRIIRHYVNDNDFSDNLTCPFAY